MDWLGNLFGWFGSLLASWRNLLRKKPSKYETKKYVVNDFHFPGNEPSPDNRNKKFADERQKAKRNRKKKPSKKMTRLYQLKKHGQYQHVRRV